MDSKPHRHRLQQIQQQQQRRNRIVNNIVHTHTHIYIYMSRAIIRVYNNPGILVKRIFFSPQLRCAALCYYTRIRRVPFINHRRKLYIFFFRQTFFSQFFHFFCPQTLHQNTLEIRLSRRFPYLSILSLRSPKRRHSTQKPVIFS